MNLLRQQMYCSYCLHHKENKDKQIVCGLSNALPVLDEGCSDMKLAQKNERNLDKDPLDEMNKKFEKSIPLYLKVILFILFVYFMSRFLYFSSTVVFQIK